MLFSPLPFYTNYYYVTDSCVNNHKNVDPSLELHSFSEVARLILVVINLFVTSLIVSFGPDINK